MAVKGIMGLIQACLLLQSRLHLCLMTVSGACMQYTQFFGDLHVPRKQHLPSYTCLSARKRAGCHALQQIGVLVQDLPPNLECACSLRLPCWQVLQSSRASSSNECYDRCMAEPGCSFWVWCNQVCCSSSAVPA